MMKSELMKILLKSDKKANSFIDLCKQIDSCGKVFTFLNPVSYIDALEHKELFERFDGIFADGSLLVASIKLCYGVKVTRRSFDMTSIGKELFELSAREGKSLYIVASKQEEVDRAVKIFCDRFVGINVVGYRNGFFASEKEMEDEAKRITMFNPDFLIIGMGIIKQEEFLLRVKSSGYQGIGFTCGGFIRQTACGEADYYPEWINRLNLRFLYRMWKEPHTRKRYFMAGLVFPVRFVWERFFG